MPLFKCIPLQRADFLLTLQLFTPVGCIHPLDLEGCDFNGHRLLGSPDFEATAIHWFITGSNHWQVTQNCFQFQSTDGAESARAGTPQKSLRVLFFLTPGEARYAIFYQA